MRIFLAGATGAIGKPLVPALLAAGHQVIGMTRWPSRAVELNAAGVESVICNVFDTRGLNTVVKEARPELVMNQLSDLPQRMDASRLAEFYANHNRVRVEGSHNLLDAAIAAGARSYQLQSVAFFYEPDGEPLKTEDTPLRLDAPQPTGSAVRALLTTEQAATSLRGIQTTVLRYGYFYGPGTYYANIEEAARRVPRGGIYTFIHVQDAAEATVAALEVPPGTYNVVDDTWLGGLRAASNAKFKQSAPWTPRHAGLSNAWPTR